MNTGHPAPLAMHVVVPAHDEADLIDDCLSSIRVAVECLRLSTGLEATVTVVADSCSDRTAELAGRHGAAVVVIDARNVGAARDAGARQALALSAAADRSRVWIATTDADSTVPPQWLEDQFSSSTTGAGLWVGAATPDPSTVSSEVLLEWQSRHELSAKLHVYGANLGFTAATYVAAGGFHHLTEHEDVAFVEAAIEAGVTWGTGGRPVQTSGRIVGRTPGGFAGYVRLLVAELDPT